MIDLTIRLYTACDNKVNLLNKLKLYSACRFLIRILANVSIPAYFYISNLLFKNKLPKSQKQSKRIVVSLTSFPKRIDKVWIVIECILRQRLKPDIVVLWLSKEQFCQETNLPKSLTRLKKRGLEIRFCEGNLRSHKKYYYALQRFKNDLLITIDDDIIYPTYLTKDLFDLHLNYPTAICCCRALKINVQNAEILPYNTWELVDNSLGASYHLFQTSGGGTLFPPKALHTEVTNDKVFMSLCRYADDVWLNAMSQMNNTKVVKTERHFEFIPLLTINDQKLSIINVEQGKNDQQLNAVRQYYISRLNQDPFINATYF